MKKFLLFAAAALAASMAFAQDAPEASGGWVKFSPENRPADDELKNYVVNGNFDDPGYTMEIGEDGVYGSWYPFNDQLLGEATNIPGWILQTSGKWNGTVQIDPQEPDDYMIFEGNTQCLSMHHYDRNGWTRIRVINIVENLIPGKEYTLDMYVASNYSNVQDWSNPDHGFSIYGKDASGELMHEVEYKDDEGNVTGTGIEPFKGPLLYENKSISEDSEFEYFRYTFVPLEDAIFLELWSQVYHGKDGDYESGHCWAAFDEIRIYDANEVGGINSVVVNEGGETEYYTLQGIRMPAGSELHGTFIVKQGGKASKMVIR